MATDRVASDAEPHDTPPLMIVTPKGKRLSDHMIASLKASLDRARSDARIMVLEGGMKVYQCVEGRWVPLDGDAEGPPAAEPTPPGSF